MLEGDRVNGIEGRCEFEKEEAREELGKGWLVGWDEGQEEGWFDRGREGLLVG